MKYKIITDTNNYVEIIAHTDTEEDTVELNMDSMNINYINCYKLDKDELIFDNEKYLQEIEKREKRKKLPTWQDKIESQTFYTAMITDTLIEEDI